VLNEIFIHCDVLTTVFLAAVVSVFEYIWFELVQVFV
jgi:hypothetical protein